MSLPGANGRLQVRAWADYGKKINHISLSLSDRIRNSIEFKPIISRYSISESMSSYCREIENYARCTAGEPGREEFPKYLSDRLKQILSEGS